MGRRVILFVLFFIMHFAARGQQDTIYYDDYNKVAKDSARYYIVYRKEKGGGYSGVSRFIKTNGIKDTGCYSSADSELRDGSYASYYYDGYRREEGSYIHSKRTGVWKQYYDTPDGTLWANKHYKNGKLDGELTSYYKSRKLKRREYHHADDNIVSGNCYSADGKEIAFTPFDIPPKPTFNLDKYLTRKLHYPSLPREERIEGKVMVQFTVNEDGHISGMKVIDGIGAGFDKEAIRVLSKMKAWTPGMQDDVVTKIYFIQPITFMLH